MAEYERRVGTVVRGIRMPIIREGDDLAEIVATGLLEAAEFEGFSLRDRDVVAMTESIVARAQGNYCTVDDIADDVREKLGGETIGVIFPILSRNRFAICLRGIARGCKKIVLMLSYPSDEVGNSLLPLDKLDASDVNPYSDVLSLEQYREKFGVNRHEFTGVDYVEYYTDLIHEEGAEVEIIFANHAQAILDYTDHVLNCDIHTRDPATAPATMTSTDCSAPTSPPKKESNCSRKTAKTWSSPSRKNSCRRPANMSKSWSTAMEPSKTRRERSGNSRTRSCRRLSQTASSAPRMNSN